MLDEVPSRNVAGSLLTVEALPIAFLSCARRQLFAESRSVLSKLAPLNRRPSSGKPFHCLHATSQALQPMHRVVSVKKPTASATCTHLMLRGRKAPRLKVARKRLALMDGNVWIADERGEVVRDAALC